MEIIKVAIVDANALVGEGLKRIVALEPDLLFVGQAVDEVEMAELLERTSLDVLLLDLEILKRSKIHDLLESKEKPVHTKVFILSCFPDQVSILDAGKAGARGYVHLTGVNPSTITHAIRMIHMGEIWVDRRLACSDAFAQLARRRYRYDINEGEDDITRVLSKSEREIISLLAKGLSNEKIAKKLFIGEGTVKTHVRRICHKLGIKNRTQAALLYVEYQSRRLTG